MSSIIFFKFSAGPSDFDCKSSLGIGLARTVEKVEERAKSAIRVKADFILSFDVSEKAECKYSIMVREEKRLAIYMLKIKVGALEQGEQWTNQK